jgi:hypothetical protein
VSSSRPTLDAWLASAPTTHPWRTADPGVADALEHVLATVERAAPTRLASKKRTFAKDVVEANVLNLRVELLVAALLAEAPLSFEFGGPGEPDIRVAGTDWLEITTRTKDHLRLLHDELEAAIDGSASAATVNLRVATRPLAIPKAIRDGICSRILSETAMAPPGATAVALPQIGGTAMCLVGTGCVGMVTVEVLDSDLMHHLEEVECAIVAVTAEKTEQALRGRWDPNTNLLIPRQFDRSERRSSDSASTTFSPMTTCSVPCTPTERLR